jgi:hypothetical protein
MAKGICLLLGDGLPAHVLIMRRRCREGVARRIFREATL